MTIISAVSTMLRIAFLLVAFSSSSMAAQLVCVACSDEYDGLFCDDPAVQVCEDSTSSCYWMNGTGLLPTAGDHESKFEHITDLAINISTPFTLCLQAAAPNCRMAAAKPATGTENMNIVCATRRSNFDLINCSYTLAFRSAMSTAAR